MDPVLNILIPTMVAKRSFYTNSNYGCETVILGLWRLCMQRTHRMAMYALFAYPQGNPQGDPQDLQDLQGAQTFSFSVETM